MKGCDREAEDNILKVRPTGYNLKENQSAKELGQQFLFREWVRDEGERIPRIRNLTKSLRLLNEEAKILISVIYNYLIISKTREEEDIPKVNQLHIDHEKRKVSWRNTMWTLRPLESSCVLVPFPVHTPCAAPWGAPHPAGRPHSHRGEGTGEGKIKKKRKNRKNDIYIYI